MNKNIKNILKEKITRINISQKEIIKNTLRSISQNNNIGNFIKIYVRFLLNKNDRKSFFLTRKHKICLLTGKRSGILKGFSFSRYMIKSLILQNKCTNIKKSN
jgi:ribosomal protein S14